MVTLKYANCFSFIQLTTIFKVVLANLIGLLKNLSFTGLAEILQVFSLLIYMQGKFMWKINKIEAIEAID